MKIFLIWTGAIAVSIILILFFAIAGALFGAIGGWTVEHTPLAEFVVTGMSGFGFHVQPSMLPAIGAFLGFISGFVRASVSTSSKKD